MESRVLSAVAVLLLSPLASGQTPNQGFLECVDVLHRLQGEAAGDLFGWVSAPLPDVTGDGVDELIVGAIGADVGAASNKGAVYLFDGASGAQLFKKVGGRANQALGTSVACAGDVNGDGVDDVIAGAPGNAAQIGQARVYSGVDGLRLYIIAPGTLGDQAGATVAGVGDIDGDGFDDVALGAPNESSVSNGRGRVWVVSGSDGTTVLWSIDGEAAGDQFGSGMGALGDVNGDSKVELAIGALNGGASNRGRAYVYDLFAQGQMYTVNPSATAVNYGQFFVYTVGDVNGDGLPDLYVSDFADGGGRGKAYFYDGPTGDPIYAIIGNAGDGFGIGRGVGDVNSDGRDDFVMGSWTASVGALGAGQCEIFSGKDKSKLRTITSTVAGEALGFDAHGIGDVNGDGRPDYVLTAANKAGNRGAVYVVAGGDPLVPIGSGLAGSGGFVPSLSVSGCPDLGTSLVVDVAQIDGGAMGWLAIGDQELAVPFRGGTLYTNLGGFLFPHVATGTPGMPGTGTASFTLVLPNDPLLIGMEFVAQAAYLDPGAIRNVSLSAAVRFLLYD